MLIAGVLSPLIAMVIMPRHYSFYMFYPATPDGIVDKSRLLLGDSILVIRFRGVASLVVFVQRRAKPREISR